MDILTVTQLNHTIRGVLTKSPGLQNIVVRGEISGLKRHSSGHVYFNLKDENASVPCAMYRSSAARLRFEPKNGLSVLAAGSVSVYVEGGYYQLVCVSLQPEGIGELELAFRQMFERLDREGLFDPRRKKPLPWLPETVGVVTSASGKAIHDIVETLRARCPIVQVLLIPVRVQGEGAAREIADAIAMADRLRLADVLIVGRGGGKPEELWPFNEEIVARAICACRIPVVSAVGHEPDHSISDYAADAAAATPTQAAMRVVPDRNELRQRLDLLGQAMVSGMTRRINENRRQLTALASDRLLQNPMEYLSERRMQLDLASERFLGAAAALIEAKKQNYYRLSTALDALSPLKILSRGYGFVQDSEGEIVSSMRQISVGQRLRLRLSDGSARVCVEELEDGDPNGQ